MTVARPVSRALLVAVLGAWSTQTYIEDDGYIHLVFARSIAEGHGFAFQGHHVFADSSPLWVYLIAGVSKLGLDPRHAALVLCGLGCLLFLYSTTLLLSKTPLSARQQDIALWVVALHPFVLTWVFAGMESITATALVTLALAAAVDRTESASRRLWIIAGCTSVGALLRFELAIIGTILAVVVVALEARRPLDPSRWLAPAIVAFAPLAVWMLFARISLGSWVPTTNAAKRTGGLEVHAFVEAGRHLAEVFAIAFAGHVFALGIWFWTQRRHVLDSLSGALAPALALVVGLLAFYFLNRTGVQTRYLLLMLPAVTWLAAHAVRALADDGRRRIALLASVAVILWGGYIDAVDALPRTAAKVATESAESHVVSILQSSVPQDWPVAVYAIGQVAYEGRQPVVDLGALVMPSFLPLMRRDDHAAMLQWARAQGARCFVQGEDVPGTRRVFEQWLPDSSWQVFPGHRGARGARQDIYCDPTPR